MPTMKRMKLCDLRRVLGGAIAPEPDDHPGTVKARQAGRPGSYRGGEVGNGCWVKGKDTVAYVYSASEYIQFGFLGGSSLKDPKGMPEGAGRYVRHIKVHSTTEIENEPSRVSSSRPQGRARGPPCLAVGR